jgi:hypothetical protein
MNIKELIEDLKGQLKENDKDIKHSVKNRNWSQAMHLESVNTALNYVLWKLTDRKWKRN